MARKKSNAIESPEAAADRQAVQAQVHEAVDRIVAAKEHISKSDVMQLLGKDPTPAPVVGRLDGQGKTKGGKAIVIPEANLEIIRVAVRNEPPRDGAEESKLLTHAWSRKAICEMLSKHMGLDPEARREPKDPYREFLGALYPDRNGMFAFKANAFKAAMISACRHVDAVAMADLKQSITVLGELVPIWGFPMNRMDNVEIGPYGNRVADIRFRSEFNPWMSVLTIRFDADLFRVEHILHLLARAGSTVGVGEWRAEKGGNFGLFDIVRGGDEEVQVLQQKIGRYGMKDLTPENTGTLALLKEHDLLDRWLELQAAPVQAQAAARVILGPPPPTTPGNGAPAPGNGAPARR